MRTSLLLLTASLIATLTPSAHAHRPPPPSRTVTFTDIAADGGAGIDYRRAPSTRYETIRGYQEAGGIAPEQLPLSPLKARGAPGVALFDYDRDGDLDIYVTNGPGHPNSLYRNQLIPRGKLRFVDVATRAGVDATEADSTGTCFGDIDNDGDQDLMVLAFNAPHSLFENNGDGTFRDISETSGISANEGAMSCAMGDVDGDGLLDIAIANISNLENILAFVADPFLYNIPNQLYTNDGNNRFADVSDSSGILELDGIPAGAATMTWAVSIIDIDQDGDQDIVFADDQAGMPNTEQGGIDRGYLQLLENDGTGRFSARAITPTGEWMGLAFADLNCDGHLDIFSSNFGDYGFTAGNPSYVLGDSTSRWFLGSADGSYRDPGVGKLIATPFGWGASAFDYDNDGDADLLFHGGMDVVTALDMSNAGALLQNRGCSARFVRDATALKNSTEHGRRTVQGLAVGDLDLDGFVDIVSVSSVDASESLTPQPYGVEYGSPFDEDGLFLPLFVPTPTSFQWTGTTLEDGTLSVEISSADNGNGSVAVDTVGTLGLTEAGVVNRDGIGATVTFTPHRGKSSIQPVLAGSSYASQDSLTRHFGLGHASHGTVDILWPGGTRNRLYNVKRSERITMPEIPCSYDAEWSSRRAYRRCVRTAVRQLVTKDVVSRRFGARLIKSAMRAYRSR